MKRRIISLLITFTLLFIGGCGDVNKTRDELEGTYVFKDSSMTGIDKLIFEDDTLQMCTYYKYNLMSDGQIKFLNLENEKDHNMKTQYIVEQSDNKYKLDIYEGSEVKNSNNYVIYKSGNDGILGKDTFDGIYVDDKNNVKYVFSKDGTLELISIQSYSINDKTIKLTGTSGSTTFSYELKNQGKELDISSGSDNNFTLMKE
ncbi:hypothetical protein [Anaerosacchariphilus polymeriproducens]|uniref:Uncharacterized protein n=1 Tax=Anaerosacchariphilus polymeriproducens TaxID=1812858 RepID=A0A371AUG5_9FIRM|nr:hypothetical protein [Anaerosacchariphilus polymeriproducens]RDU23216.1 hypothetical protein DWV06_10570 [Anaerosacchariphilus polymeriproducens]